MLKKIVILGAGGTSVELLDLLRAISEAPGATRDYRCVGFLDDDPEKWGKTVGGMKILGPTASAGGGEFGDCGFVNGIGSPVSFKGKAAVIARCGVAEERFETLVHPAASVSLHARVGRGTVLFQNVTVGFGTRVGAQVMVLPNCVLSHGTEVGDFTCIAAGVSISGETRVGRGCYLGTNAAIKERVTIGDGCLIGMGSVVLRSVPPGRVVVGNPGRLLPRMTEAETQDASS